MANIKFFKKATRPTSAGVGSVWFDSTRKAIVLTGATAADDVIYSGCITNAVVDGEKLILTKTDGNNIEVNFEVFATDAALNSGLSTKVDKVVGKGLSTNDFTTAEKNKLAGIAAGANAYSLPIASATVLGGIKVGNNLTIDPKTGALSGVADTHYANTFTIKGAGAPAATFNQSSDATLNIAAGTGISVSATSRTITIANTVANTHLTNFLDIQAAGTSVVKYTQNSDKTLKFVAGSNVTLTPNAANGTITISSTDTNTDTKVTSVGNHYTPSGGTPKTNGNILTSVTCDAAGHVTAVSGRNDIPASWITSGTIDIARLPAGALERLVVVADEAAAMKANVQEGDTVKVTGNNNKMYFCVKAPSAGATFATCFTEYTAGSATSVPWSGVTGRPNVEDGAQKNVQSDWNATSGDAFILNKPTIPTKTSQLTNDSGYIIEHQSLDNYYTKEQTDSSITAAMDAIAVPQTYDIEWMINLFFTSTDGTVTLTAEQFNEIKAAADAHKIFVAYGQVFSSSTSYHGDDIYIELTQLFGDYVSIYSVSSLNGTYNVSVTSDQIIMRDELSGYAKSSDIPTKTSQLTNDSGFLTEHQSLDGYVRKRLVVKTFPNSIGYGTSYEADALSIELAADKFHIVGRCSSLTLTLPDGADMDGQEYCCQFYVGGSFTLTIPADVRWQNGEVPTFEGNTCCQLVIANNCATIGVFKASS